MNARRVKRGQFRIARRAAVALTALVAALVLSSATEPSATGPSASADGGVTIPRDEAPHSQPVEWWYASGHLRGTDPSGHEHSYGFEYVTFQFLDDGPQPVYVANVAVTDLNRKTFQYDARPDSYPLPGTADRFDLHTGSWTMRGSDGVDELHAALPDYRLALHLRTTKPAALHGVGGEIPYGPFGTSKYYSWTSLLARGTVTDHGVPVKVRGTAWMDHQWGPIDFASGGGWDWFSVQLRGNEQYMLYFIRNSAGQVVQSVGSRIGRRGRVTHLPTGSFGERTLGSWTSPSTGLTYGSGWRVHVPGGWLRVTPMLLDQEVDVRAVQGVVYWEGTVRVRGYLHGRRVSGLGYTEINPPAVG